MLWARWRAKARLGDRDEMRRLAQTLERRIADTGAAPRALNLLGVLQAHLGLIACARQRFCQILLVSPRHQAALTNMGNLALLEGDCEEAGQYYRRALRENPFLEEPRYNLVRLYQEEGHFEKAVGAYRDYVSVTILKKYLAIGVLLALLLFVAAALLAGR